LGGDRQSQAVRRRIGGVPPRRKHQSAHGPRHRLRYSNALDWINRRFGAISTDITLSLPFYDGGFSLDRVNSQEPIELRLALVMNGGVSLAIWMGGVAHELDIARRASAGQDPPPGSSEADQRLHQAWQEVCSARRTEVVVDLVAGTSAGGLNGALLATAVARGRPLDGLRELWRDSAALRPGVLLAKGDGGLASLLDGDYFTKMVTERVGALAVGTPGSAPPPVAQAGRPVSLIVTATALGTAERAVADTSGQSFTEADHRRRYHFRQASALRYHWADGKPHYQPCHFDDFEAGWPQLALAARASAGFPVAFVPVAETSDLNRYRSYPPWLDRDQCNWLADGGILDNAPIEPLLDEMARQPVSVPIRRVVCYIVPTAAEQLGRHAEPNAAGALRDESRPDWLSVYLASQHFPGEIDFRDGITQLAAANTGSGPDDGQVLFDRASGDPQTAEAIAGAAATGFPLYQRSRRSAAALECRQLVLDTRAELDLQPPSTMRGLEELGDDWPWLPAGFPGFSPGGDWDWGLAAAERVVRLLLRSLRDQPGVSDLRAELSQRVERIVAIRDASIAALRGHLKEALDADADVRAQPASFWLDELKAVYDDLGVPSELGTIVSETAAAYPDGAAAIGLALGIEVVRFAAGVPVAFSRTPPFEFHRLGPDSGPLAFMTTPPGYDDDPGLKLYGARLMHFGAFGWPEWRMWDWMWGRLDAVAHLGKLLLLDADEVARLQHAVLECEAWSPEAVTQKLPCVLRLTKADFIKALRTTTADGPSPAAATAANALRLLRDNGMGQAQGPRRLLTDVGTLLGDLLAEPKPPGRLVWMRLARVPVSPLRRKIWGWLSQPGTSDDEPS
jgi:predicted acylesterase/phospholipase RssA